MLDQNIIIGRLRFYADAFYGLPGKPQFLRLTESQAELLAVDIRKVCNELERVTCTLCGGTGKKVVGEHETLTNEWVSDYAPCNHKPPLGNTIRLMGNNMDIDEFADWEQDIQNNPR